MFALVAYFNIFPPISRKRSKSYNEFTYELPATCLSRQDGGIPQRAFPTQQLNLPACSTHCFFNAERQTGKLLKPNLKSLV